MQEGAVSHFTALFRTQQQNVAAASIGCIKQFHKKVLNLNVLFEKQLRLGNG